MANETASVAAGDTEHLLVEESPGSPAAVHASRVSNRFSRSCSCPFSSRMSISIRRLNAQFSRAIASKVDRRRSVISDSSARSSSQEAIMDIVLFFFFFKLVAESS